VFHEALDKAGFRSRMLKTSGNLFRNTVLYFLLHRYRTDSAFRTGVDDCTGGAVPYWRVLIEAAGVKRHCYHYCHATLESRAGY